MKKGFTLIELMIVVVLLGVVYSVYFFTGAKHTTQKEREFSIRQARYFLKKNEMLLCSRDKELCYLLDSKRKLLKTFPFLNEITQYTLTTDEILEVSTFNPIELDDNIYFTPTLVYKKNIYNMPSLLIYYDEKQMLWVYISPYLGTAKEFKNQEELIRYITKKDYLPKNKGLAE